MEEWMGLSESSRMNIKVIGNFWAFLDKSFWDRKVML
jgi:hypothetical protein